MLDIRLGRTALVGAMLLFAVLLPVYAAGSQDSAATGLASEDGEVELTEAGTFPIVRDGAELEILVYDRSGDVTTNAFTQYYEDLTGVLVNWRVATQDNYETKRNLAISSGDYPDVFMNTRMNPTLQMVYSQQGVIVPLDEHIANQGVHTQRFFELYPWIESAIRLPDGQIYDLPKFSDTYHMIHSQKMWIYKPWLEQLGLDLPETTAEFYEVLQAFSENDMNGNGDPTDEIPLTYYWTNAAHHRRIDGFLMNPFIYSDTDDLSPAYLKTLKNDVVDVIFDNPRWREGLAYINNLWEAGLIDPQSFTQDSQLWLEKLRNPEEVIVGAFQGHAHNAAMRIPGDEWRWADYVTVQPLLGPDGVRRTPSHLYNRIDGGKFIVSSAAPSPALAVRWADGFYKQEVMERSMLGIEGKHWLLAESGEIGLNGKPAHWKPADEVPEDAPQENYTWPYMHPYYMSMEWRQSKVAKQTGEPQLEVILIEETSKHYEPNGPNLDEILPPLVFDENQAAEVADLSVAIHTYVEEHIARFITGDLDLNSDWNAYVEGLGDLDLQRFVELHQSAYDAKYK